MNIQQIENQKKLFIVFNQSIAKAKKAEIDNPEKLVMRVKKAFKIIQTKNYYNDPERAQYQPTKWSCGCPDYIYKFRHYRGYQGACCHMIAEHLKERMAAITYRQLDFFKIIH